MLIIFVFVLSAHCGMSDGKTHSEIHFNFFFEACTVHTHIHTKIACVWLCSVFFPHYLMIGRAVPQAIRYEAKLY